MDVAWFPRVFLPLDTNRAMANIFGKYSMEDGEWNCLVVFPALQFTSRKNG